jgi:hypothetical protein
MSDGYTPVFNSVFNGTLYGKWPDSAVWLTMLALCDSKGEIDMSYEAIAGQTGWPMELLRQGIAGLMAADPRSRSTAEEGRRLVPIDDAREWGWRVVNVQLYRRKASGLNQVLDGRNAEKVRRYKEKHRQTPLDTDGHRETPPDTPNTHSYSDPNAEEEQHRKRGADTRGSRIPLPFAISDEMRSWARSETPGVDIEKATAEFVDYWRGVSGQKGCKLDWEATWRNRLREVQSRNRSRPKQQERSEWM